MYSAGISIGDLGLWEAEQCEVTPTSMSPSCLPPTLFFSRLSTGPCPFRQALPRGPPHAGLGDREGREGRSHRAVNPGATSMAVALTFPLSPTQTANQHHTFQQMPGHSTETYQVRAVSATLPPKPTPSGPCRPGVETFPVKGGRRCFRLWGHRICHISLSAGLGGRAAKSQVGK